MISTTTKPRTRNNVCPPTSELGSQERPRAGRGAGTASHASLRALHTLVLALAIATATHSSAAETSWRFETGGKIIGKPTITSDTIYLAGGNTVHALGLDGSERWRRSLAADIAASIRGDDDTIYVHSSMGLHALSLEGEPRWTYDAEDRGPLVDGRTWGWGSEILADPWGWYRSTPLILEDAVIFGSSDGVHAVAKDSGEQLWRVPMGPVTTDAKIHGDLLVVASWNHSVYGIEQSTGKVRWRFRADLPPSKGVDWAGYQGFHLTPVIDGDRVFVGNRNTNFYALRVEDGTIAWSSKVGSSWIGSPAVTSEEHVFYGLSDGQAVLGHRKNSGALSHFFRTDSLVFAQPVLWGGQLIVGTLSGHLFSIDTVSGEGREITHFGPAEKRYAEFFQSAGRPDGLSPHQAAEYSIERMLVESNSILSLEVEGDALYVGTASGVLHVLDLDGGD